LLLLREVGHTDLLLGPDRRKQGGGQGQCGQHIDIASLHKEHAVKEHEPFLNTLNFLIQALSPLKAGFVPGFCSQ
jgi:hypothetical protein